MREKNNRLRLRNVSKSRLRFRFFPINSKILLV